MSACLYSKSWDARIAAGEAIAQLAGIFVHNSVQDVARASHRTGAPLPDQNVNLSFTSFHLSKILEKGSALLASGGQVRMPCRAHAMDCGHPLICMHAAWV